MASVCRLLPYWPKVRSWIGLPAEVSVDDDHYAALVMGRAARALWSQPAAPHPPRWVWRDGVLLAVVVVAMLLEGLLRPDVVWRPVALLLGLALAVTLPWRRTRPAAVTYVVFGAVIVLDIAVLAAGVGAVGLYSLALVVLVLPYALLRWGSGRQVVLCAPVLAAVFVLAQLVDPVPFVEAVAGLVILLVPGLLGALARLARTARERELDTLRLREREQLARELHDTVAHHVSAIVVRAQAGRVVAGHDPSAAVEALAVIEAEGSRTLTELRDLVGALRRRSEAETAPQPGVLDLETLALSVTGPPAVRVRLSGDLTGLAPSLDAATYRIGQESITNALRHARDAAVVEVQVCGDSDHVRLTVRDDGATTAGPRGAGRFGLVGMTERAALLGGTLTAGPAEGRGWQVEAVLPRTRPPA